VNSEKVLRKLFSFRRKALNYIWVQIHWLKSKNIFFIAPSQKSDKQLLVAFSYYPNGILLRL